MTKILTSNRIKTNQPHYDLSHSIKCVVRQTPLKWHLYHVEGHQNRTAKEKDLDRWAHLNILCDKEAGVFRNFAETSNLPFQKLPLFQAPWRVIIENKIILHDLAQHLQDHVQKETAINYWTNHKYTKSLSEVNWNAFPPPYESYLDFKTKLGSQKRNGLAPDQQE